MPVTKDEIVTDGWRKKFEELAITQGICVDKREDGEYEYGTTETLWQGFLMDKNLAPGGEVAYPSDIFWQLIARDSPYAFYIFQWVPYQTDAKRYRLKMLHDVKTFDGQIAEAIWPNANMCGPFKDEEVEFIRISKKQFGHTWEDTRGRSKVPALESLVEPIAIRGDTSKSLLRRQLLIGALANAGVLDHDVTSVPEEQKKKMSKAEQKRARKAANRIRYANKNTEGDKS